VFNSLKTLDPSFRWDDEPNRDFAKDPDSRRQRPVVSCACPIAGIHRSIPMQAKKEATCAVCDYPLDGNAIEVTIGGRTVEVCCEECAQKLREAEAQS
jgi:hypothetical protein